MIRIIKFGQYQGKMQRLWLGLWVTIGVAIACDVQRDYGNGGTVCVCDSNYCDRYPPLSKVQIGQYSLHTSTKSGDRLKPYVRTFDETPQEGVNITLNANVTYQEIYGFGGAFTDAAGLVISSLPQDAQDKLLASYFGIWGNLYTFGRVPIGGCDFSTHAYSLDDNEGDETLSQFALSPEDLELKIPYIQKAIELSEGDFKLFAAAWSPPPWMKTNNAFHSIGFLKEEYYSLWAQYHLRFLDEYSKHNLSFWAISAGNEPSSGILPVVPWNTLAWGPEKQGQWVAEDLGPKLEKSEHSKTLILALDDQRFQLPWWLDGMFKNSTAEHYISGIGVHWYRDKLTPASVLDETHNKYPNKFIMNTEACTGTGSLIGLTDHVKLGSWERGENYTESIIEDLNHWVNGWVDWNLALNEEGGPNWADNFVDSPIIVNATAGEFYKQPMFYAMSHFSKYLVPGSVRIDMNIESDQLQGVAVVNEQIVAVLLNKYDTDQSVSVQGCRDGIANFNIPAKSILTFVCGAPKM